MTEKLLIFEPLFYQAGKELRFEAADDVSVKGDASQLGKLVTVLLDNAVKYADGTGRVEVRLETAGRGRARLWVNSEGEPIPKEKRTLIFQRFYRDEKVRASRTGYGLGLAIAGEIAANHHAAIGVEYRDGMNCFYVNLRTVHSSARPAVIAGNVS